MRLIHRTLRTQAIIFADVGRDHSKTAKRGEGQNRKAEDCANGADATEGGKEWTLEGIKDPQIPAISLNQRGRGGEGGWW